MAERRMFAMTIINSDAFLDMPLSAQALYFHLCMGADDDGFLNNAKRVQRVTGASDSDLKVLIDKRFLITFLSDVVVIKHWRMHNYIKKDRYKETVYTGEKSLLIIKKNGSYTEKKQIGTDLDTSRIQVGYKSEPQVSLGKVSLGKVNIRNQEKEIFPVPEPPQSVGNAEDANQSNSEAMRLATLLLEKSRAHDPKIAIGKDKQTITSWSKDIEKLIRLDKRTPEEVESVIAWCKSKGNFWIPNIMSGKKLREKFPTLFAQMSTRGGKGQKSLKRYATEPGEVDVDFYNHEG